MKESMPGFVKALERSFHRKSHSRRQERTKKRQERRKLKREDSTSFSISISSHASSFAGGESVASADSIYGQSFVFRERSTINTVAAAELDHDDSSISSHRSFASYVYEYSSNGKTASLPTLVLLPEEISDAVSESWSALYERDGIEQELGVRVIRNLIRAMKKEADTSSPQMQGEYQQQAQRLQELLDREDESSSSLNNGNGDSLSRICNSLVELVDMVVTVFWGKKGRDSFLEEDGHSYQPEIDQMSRACRSQGLDPRFLKEALMRAIHSLAKHDFADITRSAWDTALTTTIDRM